MRRNKTEMDSAAPAKNEGEIGLLERGLYDPTTALSEEDSSGQFVTALARGLEILRCFTPRENVLSNQDLARKTSLPKPTVTRLTNTLMRLGCLKREVHSGKYQLDVGVLGFGYAMLSNLSIRTVAHPLMEELATHAQAAVAMAARDRLQMVYLDVVQGQGNMTMRRQIGSYLPLAVSSVGRACLAAMPENEREFLLDHIREREPENWPAIRKGLDRAFRDFADYGYCLSIGEWHRDVNSVAVPLVHPQYGLLAFNCGGPSFQLTRQKLEDDIGPRLINMVNNIGAAAR
ncbi:IclR family transcriptional regulator [Pseudomonas aeruginosa]|uniref:IclR family transcriptional regulator n=1 Tax=Pseudomonas aeruginosa TaxID=287 RepID=UPI000F53194E|nr:IclR family transcriptional regulator [Pseudomonas aeruginosa]EIU1413936.1 IclR family transcriptional regulator [Pseudomonas aeruginosa]MCG9956511.1 IclR family transcriptional regulator [Pseudomonas aeruginosa]RPW10781.1 IclR family transcriptional regulator [Pseudomonas aeruginosa]RTB51811.1 IclR family transcriptional regulator [Pseudomonas aeruginosa]RTC34189.1 IclR family transcriptional regulator [Pseudomonas aeruginosa]